MRMTQNMSQIVAIAPVIDDTHLISEWPSCYFISNAK